MNKEQPRPIGRDLLERVIRGSRDTRVYLCEQEFAAFALYYFSEFFTYDVPSFQWRMYAWLNDFTRGRFTYLLWIMFRESAKTTIAKIYVVYCIAYRKKRFINWDAFDKGNAEAALFDITTWLQTNKRIIADFGQLFIEDAKMASRYARMKRMGEFITTNKVKVKAYSTQESTRGRIFDRFRPDLYIVEDFETAKTSESVPVTAKIIKHIDELKAGLSVDGQVIFLANLITETGSVASLIQEAKENSGAWRMQMVAVEEDGEIQWPDKYVRTQEEAVEINAGITDRKQWKVSLEQKRKDLNSGGRKVYEAEMLNSPEAAGDPFFSREKVEKDLAKAKASKPVKIIGGLRVYEEFVAKYRYAFGGDTAKGVMRDSCASVGIRFTPEEGTKPAKVVGAYDSNTISPDDFGDEMAAHGRLFGECLLAPEINNTGYATMTRLKAVYPTQKIYRQRHDEQVGTAVLKDLGWEATSANVASIYYEFRSAYDDGKIEILDVPLLEEVKKFTRRDLQEASKRSESVDGAGAVTKHFDLLRAACIAWAMRSHATIGKAGRKVYKQGSYDPRSEYQGQG